MQGVQPNVLSQLQKVYTAAIETIKAEIPLKEVYEKCGGKCINLVIKLLAATLSKANDDIKKCRGSADSNCVARVYGQAGQNAQAAVANTALCLSSIGIRLEQTQVLKIQSKVVVAVIRAIEEEAIASWNLFPFT